MTYYQEKYINLIIKDILRLKVGEKLTINCNEESIYFAKDLANEAAKTTRVNVNVVYIIKGKVENVTEIEPVDPIFEKNMGNAMIYLATFDNPFFTMGEFDAKTLQEFKLLAEPVFADRQIAIPWATIYVPTLSWAEFLFPNDVSVDRLWQLINEIFDLDEDFDLNTFTQIALLNQRCKWLNEMQIEALELKSSTCDLYLPLAKETLVSTSATILPNGREFISTFPCEDIIIPLDYKKARGNFTTTYPFRLFDKVFSDASFAIENGEIIGYSIPGGEEYVSALFEVDEDSKRIGELILCESYTIASRITQSLGVPLLDRMRTSNLVLGAITPTCLTKNCEEEKFKEFGINTSLARLELPFGSNDLEIFAVNKNGDKIKIMEDGSFSEF